MLSAQYRAISKDPAKRPQKNPNHLAPCESMILPISGATSPPVNILKLIAQAIALKVTPRSSRIGSIKMENTSGFIVVVTMLARKPTNTIIQP